MISEVVLHSTQLDHRTARGLLLKVHPMPPAHCRATGFGDRFIRGNHRRSPTRPDLLCHKDGPSAFLVTRERSQTDLWLPLLATGKRVAVHIQASPGWWLAHLAKGVRSAKGSIWHHAGGRRLRPGCGTRFRARVSGPTM